MVRVLDCQRFDVDDVFARMVWQRNAKRDNSVFAHRHCPQRFYFGDFRLYRRRYRQTESNFDSACFGCFAVCVWRFRASFGVEQNSVVVSHNLSGIIDSRDLVRRENARAESRRLNFTKIYFSYTSRTKLKATAMRVVNV
jgi:hypothetical protein